MEYGILNMKYELRLRLRILRRRLVRRPRQMFMLGVVRVLASRRFAPILLEAGVVDFLQPDARSVEADDCVLADELEEIPPVFLARAMSILVSQMREHPGLLFRRNLHKSAPEQVAGMRVNPSGPVTKAILQIWIAEDYEIDELADAGFLRSRRGVRGDDQLAESRNDLVFIAGEKLRVIYVL